MKKPKISRKTATKIMNGVGLILYGVGAAMYGYFSFKEGQQAEWNYIADNADKDGGVVMHDGDVGRSDNMYLIYGRDISFKILEKIKESREAKNEQENE